MLGRAFSNFVFAEGQPEIPDPQRNMKHTRLAVTKVRITAVQHQTRRSTALPVIVSAGLANHSPSLPHQNRKAREETSDGSHLCPGLSAENR